MDDVHSRGGELTVGLVEDGRGRFGAQASQVDAPAPGRAGNQRQHVGQRVPTAHLELAQRHDDEHRPFERTRQEPEQRERVVVRPLQVVQQDDHRRCRSRRADEVSDRLEAIELVRRLWFAEAPRVDPSDPGEHPDGRKPRPERWCGAALVTPPPRDHRAPIDGDPRDLFGEPGLADPRLSFEHDEARRASGLSECRGELAQLGVAAFEGRPGEHGFADVGRRHARRRELEAGVVGKDRRFEVAQLAARLDAELFPQRRGRLVQRAQRVGLPPRAVERERELVLQVLTERVQCHHLGELRTDRRMATEQQVGGEPILQGGEPALLQPCAQCEHPFDVDEVSKHRAAPQRIGLEQQLASGCGLRISEQRMPAIGEALEPVQVDVVRVDDEPVAGLVECELSARRFDDAAQTRHVGLQRSVRRRRRCIAPDRHRSANRP